jgi:hypothetical protein
VLCRRAGPSGERLDLHGHRAASRHREAHGGPGQPLAGPQHGPGVQLAQPGRPHLEPRRLAIGPETVLPAGQHAQTRASVTLEQHDHIDGVLEGARPGQVAILRDVTGHHHRDPLLLGQSHEGIGAGPDLRDAAGERARRVAQRLDRVHRQQERPPLPCGGEHRAQVPAGREGDGLARHAESPRPRRDLPVGFLAGHEQARAARPGQRGQEMQHERGLADAGLARQERDRRRHEPSPQHTVETGEPGEDAVFPGGRVGEREHRGDRTRRA